MTRSASSASATCARRVDAGDVRLERHQRAAVARDLLRGEMDDRVAAVERRAQVAPARAVDLLEREDLRWSRRCSRLASDAAREVVDADDLDALGEQTVAEVRADEARPRR